MGAIARAAANNITTSGVFTADAITNASVTGITVLANAEDGITLISSQTASASATISFTTGIDSTYKAYKFVFVNIHPATNDVEFQFNMSTDSGSNYNVTKTSTFFRAYHEESGATSDLNYQTANDLAQSTGFQTIIEDFDAVHSNTGSGSGSMSLFNPASTTYVKHFISTCNNVRQSNYSVANYVAGYGNTTSAINAVQFKMSSGNIDDGTILMFGIV